MIHRGDRKMRILIIKMPGFLANLFRLLGKR